MLEQELGQNLKNDYMPEYSLEEIDLIDYEGLFHVVINQEEQTAVAESLEYEEERKRVTYKITKKPSELTAAKRKEVLDYRLGAGNYDKDTEQVLYEDIFMHGEFLEVVSVEELEAPTGC